MAFYINAFYLAIICANLFQICHNSYCGESAIPFSFEVLPDGHPILGCARPNCFGWDAFGKPIRANESHFYRVKNQPDGFFRKTLTTNAPKPISDKEAPWYQPQTATCQSVFKEGRCSGPNNWVGGIGPITSDRISEQNSLLLRCCKWAGLAQSSDRGIATVRNGQIVYGGEVVQGERQYAFDYVSDIHRIAVPSSNEAEKRPNLYYEVSIRRMPCIPRPEQLTWDIEPGVMKELFQRFALAEKEEAETNAKDNVNANTKKPQLEAKKSSKGHKLHPFRTKVDSEGSGSSSQRHLGASRVIETSKWVANPADDGDSEEAQHVHKASFSKGHKAFGDPNVPAESSAAIQGPFIENEIEAPAAADYEVPDEQQKQQQLEANQKNVPQSELYDKHEQQQNGGGGLPQSSYAAPSGGAMQSWDGGKKRIICDRNVTTDASGGRLRRQASCEEATVIEVPEGSQAEVQQQGNYDPGVQQQQQPTYSYQSQGGTLRQCFTGDTRVRKANGQMARMDELTVGEWIYSANQSHLVYSIVESWIHRVPDQLANFVRLRLQDRRELKLTEQHFIYKRSNCLANNNHRPDEPFPVEKIYQDLVEMVFAENVVPGDCVFAQRENSDLSLLFEQPVIAVDIVQERGIYAPMTGTGDILVEGILASCYAIEPSPILQKSIFNSLKSSPFVEMLFDHTNEFEMHLPSWLSFVVEHLMPVVLPK